MRRFAALLYKDFLLLVRDKAGLALLYLMPLVLVALMAYLQNDTFKAILENKLPVAVQNLDKGEVGDAICKSLEKVQLFNIDQLADSVSSKDVERRVANGDYQMALIIPEGLSEQLQNCVAQSIQHTFNDSIPAPVIASSKVTLLTDPTTKNSFMATLSSSLNEQITTMQTDLMLQEISLQVAQLSPMPIGEIKLPGKVVEVEQRVAQLNTDRLIPNATQHNVPAWGLFAIFFIVVSLAGNIIKEREEGSFLRLLAMPCSFTLYLISKVAVYLVICLTQVLLMAAVGCWLFPLLGLPALSLGTCWSGLLMVSVSAALAAIGFGVAIGQLARTSQQASVFGAISVVIMAALGGVWIPQFVMPKFMQIVSMCSPMNWGLSAYYDLLLRGSGWEGIWWQCLLLLTFGAVCFFVGRGKERRL